CQKYSTSPFTF
nr:immunoglobulin light chain junction region [Macaca mulatta]MOW11123.1 immunoglobulin light chain junction region [Macaca mulatta]MOX86926.1 immunoglobulin light chain junction region [Macaca mulatta]MOX89364.1 immunoglobulin light chain junction region [Macaca mulatta]